MRLHDAGKNPNVTQRKAASMGRRVVIQIMTPTELCPWRRILFSAARRVDQNRCSPMCRADQNASLSLPSYDGADGGSLTLLRQRAHVLVTGRNAHDLQSLQEKRGTKRPNTKLQIPGVHTRQSSGTERSGQMQRALRPISPLAS